MAQEGRGKQSSSPGSLLEIDEFDTSREGDKESGIDLMHEPGQLRPPFEEGLPLIHPDMAGAPANAARAQKKTPPAHGGRRATRPGLGAGTPPPAPPPPLSEPPFEDRVTPLSLDFEGDLAAADDEFSRPTLTDDPLLSEARGRYATGDYSGALLVAEGILELDPTNMQAQRYADNCRQVLEQMFTSKLGALDQTPRVAVGGDRLRWLSLDHRAGFVLSLVDGTSTVEELLDISGMPRVEALRTLCELVDQNVIELTRLR